MRIPKASQYQPVVKDEDPAIYEQWHDLVTAAIAGFIHDNEAVFRTGLDAKFIFPTYRDAGEARRMWVKHYEKIIKELRENGWTVRVKIPMGEVPIIFIASVLR